MRYFINSVICKTFSHFLIECRKFLLYKSKRTRKTAKIRS